MNSALVTTGPPIFMVGSTKIMQLSAFMGGLWWDLTGGSAVLLMTGPDGTAYAYDATIQNGGAVRPWTVPNSAGTWVRAWKATDATGIIQYTQPLVFRVIVSPGTPYYN